MNSQRDELGGGYPSEKGGKTAQSNGKFSGGRDYPALAAFIFLLLALVVTGYLSFRTIAQNPDLRSGESIMEWVGGLENRVKDWLGQTPEVRKERRTTARDHLVEGYRLFRQKRYAGALEELDRSIQMNGNDPEAYFWRGRVLASQGRFEVAAEDFRTAVKVKPDFVEAYDNLGWLLDRVGDTDGAIESFSKSIELKPDNGWAYHQRGRMHFRKGDRDRALGDAEKACALGFGEGCKAYENYRTGE